MKTPFKTYATSAAIALSMSLTMAAPSASAHGDAHRTKDRNAPVSTEERAVGRQGDPEQVTRTIAVDMSDNMRFSPSVIRVKQGETVKFLVKNKGRILHEMVLGTMAELKQHGELMRKFPEMEHDEPNMVHVAPGKKGTMVWQFTRAGEFHYACLIPGHFEAGMVGKIIVTKG